MIIITQALRAITGEASIRVVDADPFRTLTISVPESTPAAHLDAARTWCNLADAHVVGGDPMPRQPDIYAWLVIPRAEARTHPVEEAHESTPERPEEEPEAAAGTPDQAATEEASGAPAEALLSVLREAGGSGLSRMRLAEMFGYTLGQIDAVMWPLVDDGTVARTQVGRGWRYTAA